MPEENAPSMADAAAATVGALTSANADSGAPAPGGNVGQLEATQVPTEGNAPAATETPATTPTVPSLDGIDLSGLEPEIAKRIQDGFLRQQDYTRKTQEIAPLRKLVEEVGDLDKLRESYDFVTRLETDPDFLAKVASELQEYAKPNAAVTPVTPEQTPTAQLEIPQGADPDLIRTVQSMNNWIQAQEQEKANAVIVADWEAKISQAEGAIRESNPAYTQDDIDTLYELLPANEYDMFKAQEQMEKLRNKFVNATLKPHLNHPNAANPVATGSLANQPTEIRNFEDAAKATRERMRHQEG